MILQRCKNRRKNGGAVLELSIISVLLVVMAMFCLNMLILALGASVNERACRDAARMAAEANNPSDALLLARTAVKSYKGDGYFVGTPTVVTSEFIYNDFAGLPPPNTSPFVRVTTSCQLRLPAPIFVYGLNINSDTNMNFTKTYTFPIIVTAQ